MKLFKLLSLLLAFLVVSCSQDDDSLAPTPFVVGFQFSSIDLDSFGEEIVVDLSYSRASTATGSITLSITESANAQYGIDFTTIPQAIDNQITLNIANNESANSFVFQKINPLNDINAVVEFEIVNIDYQDDNPNVITNIQGNTTSSFINSASLGGSLQPNVGGPNQGNQVFIDLSKNISTEVIRDSWDLGFYGGEAFRVGINGSVYMMAAPLSTNDIDSINSTNEEITNLQPLMSIGQVGADAYIDNVSGDINGTAISQISVSDAENVVYLINLGYEVGTGATNPGSVDVTDDPRGWKKIRILRSGDDYVLQYADLDDTTHQEVTISKDPNYNFTFFSFNTNQFVDVEPEKLKWDLSFTVFSNQLSFPGGGSGAYGFSDFVIHNRKGNVEAYMINTSEFEYNDFNLNDVNSSNFLEHQTTIGSNWRSVFNGGSVHTDRFFIVKDPSGNIYKLKFIALTNENGERGYPEFEYELLTE